GSSGNGAYLGGGNWVKTVAASGAYLGGGNWLKSNAIMSASGAAGDPVVLTTFGPHNLNTGDEVLITGLTGHYASLNNSDFYVTVIDATHYSLNGTRSNGSNLITGATNAGPIVITSANHGLRSGDRVNISGVLGNTSANGGGWVVTVLNANQFS